MESDFKPVVFRTDPEFQSVEIYFAHDIHFGSAEHDQRKWAAFKREILAEPNRFVICAGDYTENAVTGSKSDIYAQTAPPAVQKEWLIEQLIELRDRVICIVPGNHEDNRITKICGLFPAYDAAMAAGIGDRYRNCFAFCDIGVGDQKRARKQQPLTYVGFVTHRLRDCKSYNGSDFIDGIDFAAYGHDHAPKDQPRAKLAYDSHNKSVHKKNIEVIDCGSFLTYGGYGPKLGYRPQADKLYKLILHAGRIQRITTVGFYL